MVETETVDGKEGNNQTGWTLLSSITVYCKDPAEFPVQRQLFCCRREPPY